MVGRSLPPDAATATPRTSRPTNAYSNSDIIDYFFDCSRSAGTCAARPRACFISFALITSAAWVPATMPLPAATCRCEDLLTPAASASAALVIRGCRTAAAGDARCQPQVPFLVCSIAAALAAQGLIASPGRPPGATSNAFAPWLAPSLPCLLTLGAHTLQCAPQVGAGHIGHDDTAVMLEDSSNT